jgi:hypothetical protein
MVTQQAVSVWDRILSFGDSPQGRAVAEYFVNLQVAEDDSRRISELAERCQLGQLTPDEKREYETYVFAGGVLAILQSRARVALREPSGGVP